MLPRALASAAMLVVAPLALPSLGLTVQPKLIDQSGRAFTLSSLRGAPLLVTFVSAHCTDACPLINAQFARTALALRREDLTVRLLTITLDPERDSPATMRDLAYAFHADPHTWLMASGNRSDVHAVMNAFGVIAQRGRRGYADVHTTFVYLLDAQGRLRQTLPASTNMDRVLVLEVRKQWHELHS